MPKLGQWARYLAVVAALLGAAAPSHADKWAVLVGISHYKDGSIPDLRFAAQDARAVRDLLVDQDVGGVPNNHVLLLTEGQGTRAAIIEAIAVWLGDPTRVHPNDQVLIFFSGHGATDPDTGERYLLPADAERDKLIASAWAMHHVHEALRRIEARQVIVLLDACHAGSAGVVPTGQEKRVAVEAARPLGSTLAAGEGRVLIASCRGDETSLEDPGAGHGAFTASLLQGLDGEADVDADEQVTLGEIYSYLSERVPARTSGRQHPMQKGEVSGVLVLTSVGTTKKRLRRLAELEQSGELTADEAGHIRGLLRQSTFEAKLAKLLLNGEFTVEEYRQAQVVRSREEWQRSSREKAIGQFLGMLLSGEMTAQAYRAAVAAVEAAAVRPTAPTAEPSTAPAAQESAQAVPPPVGPAYRPPADRATGILYVDSDPQGHEVYVDGALAGQTPLTLSEVGIGEHEVEVRSPYHRDYLETVSVGANEVTKLAPKLERGTGALVVTTDLPHAQVEVNGRPVSLIEGQAHSSLIAGYHDVKVIWGDQSWSLTRRVAVCKDQQVIQSLLAAQVSGNLTILSPDLVGGLSVDGRPISGHTLLTVQALPVGEHDVRCWGYAYSKRATLVGQAKAQVLPGQTVVVQLEPRWLSWPAGPLRTFSNHGTGAYSVAFSPSGDLLASSGDSDTIELWSVASGRLAATLSANTVAVDCVVFSPDGSALASGQSNRTIRLWNVESRRLIAVLSGPTADLDGDVSCVAFSPDGRLLVSGSSDNSIKLWDAGTGRLLATGALWQGATSVAFSPDGQLLGLGSWDHTVQLWDVGNWQLLASLSGHSDAVQSVAFSPGGKLLSSASGDGTIRLWEVASGRLTATLSAPHAACYSVAFSPDGRLLASGDRDGAVTLWDVATFEAVATLRAHPGVVRSVAFSPDGHLLAAGFDATGSSPGGVDLWQMAGQWEEAK